MWVSLLIRQRRHALPEEWECENLRDAGAVSSAWSIKTYERGPRDWKKRENGRSQERDRSASAIGMRVLSNSWAEEGGSLLWISCTFWIQYWGHHNFVKRLFKKFFQVIFHHSFCHPFSIYSICVYYITWVCCRHERYIGDSRIVLKISSFMEFAFPLWNWYVIQQASDSSWSIWCRQNT